jgi:hypothetical protein
VAGTPVVVGPSPTSATVAGLNPGGSYVFEVVGANEVGSSPDAASPSATLPAALTISSPASLAVGEDSVTYPSVTMTAAGGTGGDGWTLLSGTVPTGLSLSPTGALSGSPSAAGSVTFTVQVTDSGLATADQQETVDILPVPEVTGVLLGGTVNAPYSQSLSGTGGTSPYVWSVTAGSLPVGLSLISTGVISGTPTSSGAVTFTVQLTDLNDVTATLQYTVTVAAATPPSLSLLGAPPASTHTSVPGTTVAPSASIGSGYNDHLSGPSLGGPWTWSVTGGALPPGVQMDAGGALNGTPTAGGAYSFTVTAIDANGDTYAETLTLAVLAGPAAPTAPTAPTSPPVSAPPTAPNFNVGAAGSSNLTAPGTGPFVWSVASGALPPGLSLSAVGELSGTVDIPGTYNVTLERVAVNGATVLDAITVNVWPSDLNSRPMASTPDGGGYWVVGANGAVKAFGDAKLYGSLLGHRGGAPVINMAATPDGEGYWLLAANGAVSAFGNARSYGSILTRHLNQPVVAMTVTPDGKGYWLIASDGGVFSFGDAHFYGSAAPARLGSPVVGFAAVAGGTGYWLVTATGAVLPYGSARSYGHVTNTKLVGPVVGIAATPNGEGYWLVAKDGGVFAFGSAKFHGSLGRHGSVHPIYGMVATNDGGGYWLVAQNGGVTAFGDATDHGSADGLGVGAHS